MPLCPVCREDVQTDDDGVNFRRHTVGGQYCTGSGKLATVSTINRMRNLQALYKERNSIDKALREMNAQRELVGTRIETELADAQKEGWSTEMLTAMDLAS